MDFYAVLGNPIAHSKSPWIHAQFALQTQQSMHYSALLGPEGEQAFAPCVDAFRAGGGKGLNITLPYKLQAFAYAQAHGRLTERAAQAGAVNTLMFEGEEVVGDNTDGAGLMQDIEQNLGVSLANKTILVLGAGGAVRGIMGPLMARSPKHVVIANRSAPRAKELAEQFGAQGHGFDEIKHSAFDVIINGTSASVSGQVPPVPRACVAPHTLCYDMMYDTQPTPFMQWAQEAGAQRVVDGLGMLVGQAAEAFYQWRGIRPSLSGVIDGLRARMV
jgi:shikimate dehydrogenase